jgi:hypothetical protein
VRSLTNGDKTAADNIGRTLAPGGWRPRTGLARVAALDRGNDASTAPDQAAQLADHAGLGLRGIVGGDLRGADRLNAGGARVMNDDGTKAGADRHPEPLLTKPPMTVEEFRRHIGTLPPPPKPMNVWPIKVVGYGAMLFIAAWWLPAGLTLLAISIIWDCIRWWRRSR